MQRDMHVSSILTYASGDIEVAHTESATNLADIFAKALPCDVHLALVRALGLTD
jgi:hypothetical protein